MSDFECMTEQVKAKTRDKENTWTCCLCDVSYPCEAFGAQASSAEDVYSKCVLPGCWVKCMACTRALECRYKNPNLAKEMRTCLWCNITKSGDNFADEDYAGENWCRQCELGRHFKTMPCRICHKQLPCAKFLRDEQRKLSPNDENTFPTCDRCMPPPTEYECKVCETRKDRSAFYSLCRLSIRRFHLVEEDDWKFVEPVWKKRKG